MLTYMVSCCPELTLPTRIQTFPDLSCFSNVIMYTFSTPLDYALPLGVGECDLSLTTTIIATRAHLQRMLMKQVAEVQVTR